MNGAGGVGGWGMKPGSGGTPGRPKLLITPIFHDFFRFFPVFPGAFGRASWIPGVQTVKMGERWGKMGKKWVKNEITGLQKTALMHASAHLAVCASAWTRTQQTALSALTVLAWLQVERRGCV